MSRVREIEEDQSSDRPSSPALGRRTCQWRPKPAKPSASTSFVDKEEMSKLIQEWCIAMKVDFLGTAVLDEEATSSRLKRKSPGGVP